MGNDKDCCRNKTGSFEAKECGTIFWNEYPEEFFLFSCKFCNEWFKNIDEFFKHIQIHRKETIYIDNLNEDRHEEIKEKIDFTDFSQKMHNYDDEVCDIFPETNLDIPQESQNLDVELQENSEPTDILDSCSQKDKFKLQQLQKQSDQKKLKCKFCDRILGTSTRRKEHERIHTGEKPYKCQNCSETFRTSRMRSDHCKRCEFGIIIPNVSKPKACTEMYECDICQIKFREKGNLKIHKLRHDGIKKFQCSYCEKKFYTTTERNTHERSHTGSRPYLCMTCGKSYSTSSHLAAHIRTHKGIKLHKCQICGKEYYSSSKLKDHIATHSNLKPFKCETCDAAFATKKGRSAHKKLHDEVGKYSCTICNKIFKQYSGLYSHLKVHNVEKLKEHIHKKN